MSVKQEAGVSLEDKIHRTITWYRVPLMAIATAALVSLLHSKQAFWYAVPVIVLGELIQLWATSHLHKDKHFTISGPYSHVRNPMYFGRFFVGLGYFIMTWNPCLVIGYVILYSIYANLRVGREERRLQVIFEPHYQHYCTEIRRWIPRLKPYSKSENRRAKWSQVCANHEQIVAIGILVVTALVYLRIDKIAWHLTLGCK
ncbi:MAG: isoprenylcysteine carboxylmethyltransferase family protein [Armatimonadota bacterium]|nr:isoprenylcysteine carboxylmethyltransferase family protein [bacterium]